MQTTLRVEWTELHYILPDSIACPVGNIIPLLKAGDQERAISAAVDTFLCRLENRDDPVLGTLLKCSTKLDFAAKDVAVVDLRLEDEDELIASLVATYVIEFSETREACGLIMEWVKKYRSTATCFLPYLLIDDGGPVWAVSEPVSWGAIRVTETTSAEK